MGQVVIKVFKDQVSTYPDGCERAVSAAAQVIGLDNTVYTEIYPPACGEVLGPSTFLKLRENGNFIWTDETIETWNAKVNSINCCAEGFELPAED